MWTVGIGFPKPFGTWGALARPGLVYQGLVRLPHDLVSNSWHRAEWLGSKTPALVLLRQ
jgi:hypothetical protein